MTEECVREGGVQDYGSDQGDFDGLFMPLET